MSLWKRILTGLLFCVFSFSYAADVTITETGASSPINPHVYGVMTQGAYTVKSQENDVYFQEDSTALSIIGRMPLDNIRFLGGTNTWANSIYNKGHGYKTHCGGLLVDDLFGDCLMDEDEPYNFHYQYVDVATATGITNALYVTNYLQPASELETIIPYWQSQGINVFAVELGNEYHLPAFRTAFPSPSDYADWAETRAAEVKAIDPSIKTGIMIPKPYMLSFNSYYQNWMNVLSSRYQAGTLDIDFIVSHIYQQVAECYDGATCEEGRACVADWLPWTDDPSRVGIDTRYQMFKTWYYEFLPSYFPGCELFFTEWALKERSLGHGNTMMSAWHVVRELMEFHRANHEYDGIIGCANYMKLLHPRLSAGDSLLQPYTIPAYGVQSPNLQSSTTFIGSTESEAFSLFKPVQNGYYLETIQNKPSGMDPYIRVELLQATDGTRYLFYANHSDTAYTVSVSGENTTLYGDWTDQGGMTICQLSGWTLPTLATYADDDLMRPRSVGRIRVESGLDITPPDAPTSFSATADNCRIYLDWDDNLEEDLAGYTVYRSDSSGGGYTKLNETPLGASDYTDNDVFYKEKYYYVVTASDTNNNESENSDEIMATLQNVVTQSKEEWRLYTP